MVGSIPLGTGQGLIATMFEEEAVILQHGDHHLEVEEPAVVLPPAAEFEVWVITGYLTDDDEQ